MLSGESTGAKVLRRIGCDTESTGAEFRHNSQVYQVAMAYEPMPGMMAEVPRVWTWRVNPSTREVTVPEDEAREVRHILEADDNVLIFGNAKFDITGLAKAVQANAYTLLRKCRDIVIESHLLNSKESHAVKDLAFKYCDIGMEDVEELKISVNAARSEATLINNRMAKLGFDKPFMIAAPEVFAYMKRSPDGGWWICDTWLPASLERWKRWMNMQNPALAKKVIASGRINMKHESGESEEYVAMDAIRALAVDSVLYPEIQKEPSLLHIHDNIQTRLLEVFYRMESFGVAFNTESLADRQQYFSAKALDKFKRCVEIAGLPDLNCESPDQLVRLIYGDWKVPVAKWTKSEEKPQPSTDMDTLCDIIKDDNKRIDADKERYPRLVSRHAPSPVSEFCRNLIIGKKSNKLAEDLAKYKRCALSYQMSPGKDWWWRLNPSYNITGTDTVRISAKNPNPMNITKGKQAFDIIKEILKGENMSLRSIFGPKPGREWWSADYKQIQLAIFAYKSGDKEMIKTVEAGHDFHGFMHKKIFDDKYDPESDAQRTIAKNVDFGYIFGAGDTKIETTAKMPGLMDTLRVMFPIVTEFIRETSNQVRRTGVVYAGGYPLQVDQSKPYAGVNYIVQGYEGLIAKEAMVRCHDYLMENTSGQGQLTLMVHDELVFDFPIGMGEQHVWTLRECMQEAGRSHGMKIGVDFKYTTTNWADTIKVVFDAAA